MAIRTVVHRLGQLLDLPRIDIAHAVCDFLDTSDLKSLAAFNHFNEVGGLQQRLGRSHIEPRDAASKSIELQFSPGQVNIVDIRNFELSAV